MGTVDRIVRTVIGIILLALIVAGQIRDVWAAIAAIVTAAFLVTSATGFCPGYWPFKLSTRSKCDQTAQ